MDERLLKTFSIFALVLMGATLIWVSTDSDEVDASISTVIYDTPQEIYDYFTANYPDDPNETIFDNLDLIDTNSRFVVSTISAANTGANYMVSSDRLVAYVLERSAEDYVSYLENSGWEASARDTGTDVSAFGEVNNLYGIYIRGSEEFGTDITMTTNSPNGDKRLFLACEIKYARNTLVDTINVSGASGNEITIGYDPSGSNSYSSYSLSTTPSQPDNQIIYGSITSGSDIIDIELLNNAYGHKTTSLRITPLKEGTATIQLKSADQNATKTITVNVVEKEFGTLTYNANGGSGEPPDDDDTTTDGEFMYIISDQEPYRSGYDFIGWSETRNGTPQYCGRNSDLSDVNPDLEYRFYTTDADAVLYACWEVTTYDYSLVYNMNGGSGGPSNENWNGQTTSTYRTTISVTVPVRTDGYVFDYWSGSDGKTYRQGDQIVLNPGTTTLTAMWKQNQYTCHLNYSAPGASNIPDNDEYSGTETSDHRFTIENMTPTMDGYVFLYWSCEGESYDPRDTIDVPYNGTKTLTAIWDAAQLEITSTQNSIGMVEGEQFSYTVSTSHEGCTISVSGADWLSVSGNVISGVPTEKGPYDVTVTVHKDGGYIDGSQSFTITVYSKAGFVSKPGADGFYTYMLD